MADITIYPYGTNGQLPSSVGIVNDLVTGGSDKALSAEMGKELSRRISDSQSHPIDIVDDIDSDAASSAISIPSARMVKEIYLNLKALFNPESGLANLAFVGQRPAWVTVAKRHFALTFGTLDGLDSTTPVKDAEGNAVTSGTQVNEGYLKLILVPQSASHVFTSITINGEQVTSTPTGANDGSVFIEITVAGPITLAASAVSGRAVIFTGSTGCTIDDNSVQAGQDLNTTIRANEHFTLPQHIEVKVGNNTTLSESNYNYSPAQDGKTATLFIDKQYITSDITVTCNAVENGHVFIDLDDIDSNVVVKVGNTPIDDGDKIYNSEGAITVSIEHKPGVVFTAAPTAMIGNSQATMSGSSLDGVFSFEIGQNVSNGTTVSITANTGLAGNVMYTGVWYEQTTNGAYLHVGRRESCMVSPLIDVGLHNEPLSLDFATGETTSSKYGLVMFDNDMEYAGFVAQDASETTASISTSIRYVRLMLNNDAAKLALSYIKNGNDYLFNGSVQDITDASSYKDFLSSIFCKQPNSNGEYEGFLYGRPNQKVSTVNNWGNGFVGNGVSSTIISLATAVGGQSALQFVITPMVDIPQDGKITFYAGADYSNNVFPSLFVFTINNGEITNNACYGCKANPRALEVQGKTNARFVLPLALYNSTTDDIYIMETTSGKLLWGSPYAIDHHGQSQNSEQ